MTSGLLPLILEQVLKRGLNSPLLSYAELPQFRQQLSQGLSNNSTAYNAVLLGAQSATSGMAFLSGYQNAIRCLDQQCPNDQLAAFCVSEKGIKKPWDMATTLSLKDDEYILSGNKGYVMLLPDDLDRLYIIAKNKVDKNKAGNNNVGSLSCLHCQSHTEGLSITEPLKTPFINDIPHSGVCFDHIKIPKSNIMPCDGHTEANKPFRYWEDIHVTLAMMAWMIRDGVDNGKELKDSKDMMELMYQLIQFFEEHPNYYAKETFPLLDRCQNKLEGYSNNLSAKSLNSWQRDRPLCCAPWRL